MQLMQRLPKYLAEAVGTYTSSLTRYNSAGHPVGVEEKSTLEPLCLCYKIRANTPVGPPMVGPSKLHTRHA